MYLVPLKGRCCSWKGLQIRYWEKQCQHHDVTTLCDQILMEFITIQQNHVEDEELSLLFHILFANKYDARY